MVENKALYYSHFEFISKIKAHNKERHKGWPLRSKLSVASSWRFGSRPQLRVFGEVWIIFRNLRYLELPYYSIKLTRKDHCSTFRFLNLCEIWYLAGNSRCILLCTSPVQRYLGPLSNLSSIYPSNSYKLYGIIQGDWIFTKRNNPSYRKPEPGRVFHRRISKNCIRNVAILHFPIA